MGYNYDKLWLDKRIDDIKELVGIADQHDEMVYQFETFAELSAFRLHIRSLLAALAVHYPQYAYVTEQVRTWKEIDSVTGAIYLHVGTADNYRGRPRQLKDSSHRKRMVDPKVRGAKPQPQVVDAKQLLQSHNIPTEAVKGAEVMPFQGLMTETEAREWLTIAVNNANPLHMVIDFETTQLSTKFAAQLVEEAKAKGWTLDDSESAGDIITRLKLRRVGSTQEVV